MDNKKLFIANWKSNKTTEEALAWLNIFKGNLEKIDISNKTVAIFPPFTLLSACNSFIKENNLPISLGVQNISKFESGPYTGEISASLVKEFVRFALIGHSERRKYFKETDQDVSEKTKIAKNCGLKTIVCIQKENNVIPKETDFVAYEPELAVGTGQPETTENIINFFKKIKDKSSWANLIYGGSVDENNIQEFLKIPDLSGLLIGTKSLDPYNFIKLLI